MNKRNIDFSKRSHFNKPIESIEIKETRRAQHRQLLHDNIANGYNVVMLLKRTDSKRVLQYIYWLPHPVSFIDAAYFIYQELGIDAETQRNRIHAHDLLGGGGFYPLKDTPYTLYCCQPKQKRKECRCGKDSFECGDYNHSLMDGIEYADYYCEYCFFDRNEITVEDDFICNPQQRVLQYSEEYLNHLQEEERKAFERIAKDISTRMSSF